MSGSGLQCVLAASEGAGSSKCNNKLKPLIPDPDLDFAGY
jgi:hypothetical protein